MHFHVQKRKQTPIVIIVALVDVLIVLLIFLMVTTTFKQQPALKLALPESSHGEKTSAQGDPPLIISIAADGSMRLGQDNVAVTADSLKAQLVAAREKNPEVRVAINADENAPWGKIVKVKDAVTAAQIKSLVAFTKEAKP